MAGISQLGWIPPGPSRGGFADLWEGANVPEIVSHPYSGSYWIAPPPDMRGHSLLPLANSAKARSEWDSNVFIQISASMCGRALRTPEWCYCVYDPTVGGNKAPYSTNYAEFALYSISGDPAELTNLIGRPQYKDVTAQLRAELERRIVAAGEPAARIAPAKFFA